MKERINSINQGHSTYYDVANIYLDLKSQEDFNYTEKFLKETDLSYFDLSSFCLNIEDRVIANRKFGGQVGIFVHLYYAEMAKEIASFLKFFPFDFKLYVSTDSERKKKSIVSTFSHSHITNQLIVKVLPNRGWDIGPFLVGFRDEIRNHELCLKLHGKKSSHNSREFGESWRSYLFSELVGDKARISYIVNTFLNYPNLGLLMPKHWKPVSDDIEIGNNYKLMAELLNRIGISLNPTDIIDFPSGSMFWFRSKAFGSILDFKLDWDDFEATDIKQRDITLSHSIERSFLFFVVKSGYNWAFLPCIKMLSSLTDDECAKIIRKSGQFDANYYLTQYPETKKNGCDPIQHYCEFGWKEDRNPSAHFDSLHYEKVFRNFNSKKVNPLVHYILVGKAKGVIPYPSRKFPTYQLVDDLYSAYKDADLHPDYEAESFPNIRPSTVKLIAFYFPQYHPFEENDRFWGRGFTEWTNTTKTAPMFEGHYQPRLPGELGFYDTRLKEVLNRQIELAKQYGIYGFCLHHYFFDKKPVMRAPFNLILSNQDLDIPFCLHWANEPWTVRWDGLTTKTGMLLDQNHSEESDIAFFDDIAPVLNDPRYITVDSRPLLIIYRPGLFPNMKKTIERWRKCCHKLGLKDLYLALMHTEFEGIVKPGKYGFDAAIEYPPHNLGVRPCNHDVQLYDPAFMGDIYDYEEAVQKSLNRRKPKHTMFRGVLTGWDCTPRRANPDIFINCKPSIYQDWLEGLCRYSEKNLAEKKRFVFINAWNEWAEGAYLEPDRKYGYGYLGATARALNRYTQSD
ncbi:glycoside hydrolase family 99-like domain-containing protein [Thermodesulfobacteriota bacterium]